jgi:cytosine deaminase
MSDVEPTGSPCAGDATILVTDVTLATGERRHLVIRGDVLRSMEPAGRSPLPGVEAREARTVAGAGLLALPAFVDIHVHPDKAYLRHELPPADGRLESAIEALRARKRRYTVEEVAARATRLLRSSVLTGTTRIRAHVDIDPAAGLLGLEGVQRAAAESRDLCEVQLVAFPQEGIGSDPSVRTLMEQAVERGVHAVGGMPHREPTVAEQRRHVAFCFDLATAGDLDVDMHVDETDDADVRTLEIVVDEAIRRGWEGRVTVGHVCALAAADEGYAARVIQKCRDARVNVVANPATNLVLQGRGDRGLVRRGVTRVAQFRAAGVDVCFGQDNVVDSFYPFGRGDMLEIAFLASHAAHLTSDEELAFVLDAVTEIPARVWGAPPYGLRAGQRADIALFRAGSWADVLRDQRPPELVFFRGRPVARTRTVTELGNDVIATRRAAGRAGVAPGKGRT